MIEEVKAYKWTCGWCTAFGCGLTFAVAEWTLNYHRENVCPKRPKENQEVETHG